MRTGALQRWLSDRFWARAHRRAPIATWLHEPVVRRRVNRRVTGDPNVWPLEQLAAEVKTPLGRAVSLGCGTGALEQDLRRKRICREVVGMDRSETALAVARETAARKELVGIEYQRCDLDRLDLPERAFDSVFFHQSLHHVAELERCLDTVARSLIPGGLLYLDEYVGPSRGDWSSELMEEARRTYRDLPNSVKRRRRLPPPIDWKDPSEAVRSGEILPEIGCRFEVRETRGYGGNLLAIVHPMLDLDRLTDADRTGLLEGLLDREDEFLAADRESFYTVLRAVPLS